MSTESPAPAARPALRPSPPCRALAEYLAELVARLDAADPRAGRRLRELTDGRVARITLDDETVDLRFKGGRLLVSPPDPGRHPDGSGATDRRTTLDLLAGRLEVSEAILAGRLEARGDIDDVTRLFRAVEILLDAATRAPALQRLARDYRDDPCRAAPAPGPRAAPPTAFGPVEEAPGERALLRRLDLLP